MSFPTHPLKDKWFFFYQKIDAQNQQVLQEGDYITTIEEAFWMMNTMPHTCLLPDRESISLSRDKVEPKFESFPKGYRITIFARSKAQVSVVVPRVFAAVLGEAITRASVFENVEEPRPRAGVIRLTHKPHRQFPDSTSIDVWFPEDPHMAKVQAYFTDLTKCAAGVVVTARELE